MRIDKPNFEFAHKNINISFNFFVFAVILHKYAQTAGYFCFKVFYRFSVGNLYIKNDHLPVERIHGRKDYKFQIL